MQKAYGKIVKYLNSGQWFLETHHAGPLWPLKTSSEVPLKSVPVLCSSMALTCHPTPSLSPHCAFCRSDCGQSATGLLHHSEVSRLQLRGLKGCSGQDQARGLYGHTLQCWVTHSSCWLESQLHQVRTPAHVVAPMFL